MGAALTRGCLKRPVTVLVSLIALMVFALISITGISLKLMPEINYPMMAVYTMFPGAIPEEQDELVATKIEEAVSTLSGVKTSIVRCYQDYNYVLVQFDYGTNMDDTYDDVRKKIDSLKASFPEDVKDPVIMEMDVDSMDDITLSVTAAGEGVDVLNEVDEHIEPELKKISALAQTTVTGGDEKYISVELIPEYASQYGLTISSVADAITAVNFSMPAGSVAFGDQTVNLSSKVKYETIPELEQVPVTTRSGKVIHLSDVAKIGYSVKDKTSLSRYNGEDDVSIGLKRKQSASAVTLSRQLKPVLEDLKEAYPNLVIDIVEDSADTILDSLISVGETLLIGIALSMLVLFIFFGDFKASFIVGSSMPISLLVTVICMYFMGFSLNIVTMSALVIGIGMMVDNAIVVIEMCFRKRDEGMTFFDAAYEGTKIVISSITGSTITTVVVYLPLARMQGLSGQLFNQLGYTIIFALMASLISAMTIIPFFFMRYQPVEKKVSLTNRILERVSERYGRLLATALRLKKTVFLISVLLFAGAVALATQLDSELMSSTDEGVINVSMTFRPNLSLEEMDKNVLRLEEYIASQPEIDRYTATVNEASSSATVTGYRAKKNKTPSQEIADRWNLALRDFSAECELNASSGSSSGMGGLSTGVTKELDLQGTNLEDLKLASSQIEEVMKSMDGVLFVESSTTEGGSKAEVVIDPVMAQARGFSAGQLSGMVYTNMTGKKTMDVNLDGKEYSVTVEYPTDRYQNLSDIDSMTFTSPAGIAVPLTEMAEVKFASSPREIQKQDGLYYASVTATLTKDTVDEVGKQIDEAAHGLEFPSSVDFATSASDRMMKEEFTAIAEAIFIAVFLVFMVMAIQFESMAYSLLIMLCIPFSLVGSILLLFITGVKISMVSLMGILMLAGIVVNNGIIYVDTANLLRSEGMEINTALIETGKSRLRPILMTSLTTILSMIPVALGTSENAKSMQGMGIVIIGGLFASTILTLVLLPTFYLMLERLRKKRAKKKGKKVTRKIAERHLEATVEEDDGK
ncbi:MAG: efflux RND transporter permease subunit [Lachnospiraceae bacterium]|nr:efflux RND transporter permease subunit [Lachnospiraceae bacterium]